MKIPNFIGNEFVEPAGGAWLDVIEPATGAVYAGVAASGKADVDAAVTAARDAFPAWSGLAPDRRAVVLERVADWVEARIEEFARAEAIDTGKPITLARSVDIPRAVANLRFFAEAVRHTKSETYEGVAGANTVLRQPRGVAGCISPWNLPLYLLTWKIAPALATGNTVVAKPSELTPMTAHMLGEVWREVGGPSGVLNIVHGKGDSAGAALVEHPGVPTITFTGSTRVGQWIGSTCGSMLKRCSLELGGKNPFIVFADADQGRAMDEAERAGFSNQGQVCTCGSRMLVEEAIYDEFVEGLVERAKARIIGDPMDENTQHGAQISAEHVEKIDSLVRMAREDGGVVRCGGRRVAPDRVPERCKVEVFYEPTVITGVPNECAAVQQEIFGPVVTVQPFGDDDEAVALANSTAYGLAASIFTSDLERAQRVAQRIDAGIVWVNCWMLRDLRTPFGGMKQSGVGREGGDEALRFFTEAKNVCLGS